MLPLDQVKIDAMFLHEAGRGGRADAIVRSLVGLAHGLGLETVAEGVESRLAWDAAADLGCDLAQGFYLGHPMPAPKLAEWLTGSWPVVALQPRQPLRTGAGRPRRRAGRRPTRGGAAAERAAPSCERDVADAVDRGRQHRIPERGREEPDDGGARRRRAPPGRRGRGGSTTRAAAQPPSSRNDGRKIATSASDAPATPFGDGLLDRPEVGREREERPGHRLREPVAGEELLLADPPGATTASWRSGSTTCPPPKTSEPERTIASASATAVRSVASAQRGQTDEQRAEQSRGSRAATSAGAVPSRGPARSAAADGAEARRPRRPRPRRARRPGPRSRRPPSTTAAATAASASPRTSGASERRIASTASSDDGDGDELAARAPSPRRRRPPRRRSSASTVIATAEGSVKPSHAASPPRRPARRAPIAIPSWLDDGPGQQVRDGDELRELLLVEPAAPLDVLVAEVADVRDGAAERRQPEAQRNAEHLRDDPSRRRCSAPCRARLPERLVGPASALAARARMKSRSESRFR